MPVPVSCRERYIVNLGPDEADEHSAMKAEEQPDGSLFWWDTAGIPHTAPPGAWRKEPSKPDRGGGRR
jgi:hypothetical protein